MANPEKVRLLRERAEHLIAISQVPSYPILKEIVEGKIRTETRKLIGTPEITGQHLDYTRGLLMGMQTVLDVIEKGPQELDRAIAMARANEEEQ